MKKYIPLLRRLPEPGAAFNHEQFIRLLCWRREGLTTKKENTYISLELKRNVEARQLLEELKETFPGENFSPPVQKRKIALVAAIALLILAGGGYLFSLSKQRQQAPPHIEIREAYRFQNKPLSELCGVIEQNYPVRVIFDRQEVARYHYTGSLNTQRPLRIFLEYLHGSSNVEYYYDKEGNLHFK